MVCPGCGITFVQVGLSYRCERCGFTASDWTQPVQTPVRGERYVRPAARPAIDKRSSLLLGSAATAVALVLIVWLFSSPTRGNLSNLQQKVVIVKAFDKNGKQIGQGSAVIVSKDLVLTNVHVIDGAASATIEFPNGDSRDAQGISAEDIENDLATLSVVTDVAPVALGDSDKLEVGSQVIAVGNPLGLQGTVSTGIISGFRENRTLIQTTAPISPGSSGGGLFDSKGRLIGVTVAQLKGGQNLNLVVPINLAKPLLSHRAAALTPFVGKHRMRSNLTDVARHGLLGPVTRVVTRKTESLTSRLYTASEISYNAAGFVTAAATYTTGSIKVTTTYYYDTNGRPTGAQHSFTGGTVYDEFYEYDTDGQLVRTELYDGQTLIGAEIRSFDINGRLVQSDGGDGTTTLTFAYDSAGLEIEQITHFDSGLRMKETYSNYIFDKFGNWIERSVSVLTALPGQQLRGTPLHETELRMISYGD